MFGDDAFKFLLSAGFEQGITIAIKLVAELNAASLVCSSRVSRLACRSMREAEVFAIEVKQIKRIMSCRRMAELSASKSEAPLPFWTIASSSMIADWQRRLAAVRTIEG